MTKKKPSLGRNLNALLGNTANVAIKSNIGSADQIQHLDLDKIKPSHYQPRSEIKDPDLQALSASIKKHGIIQPITVRPSVNQQYELVAGERRWRAARLAGLKQIPALVRQMSDETTLAVALIENIQRQDLNPIEQARALHRLLHEFKLTHEQVAEAVGKSRTTVTNLLRLMSLEESIKVMLAGGDLEMGHARALLTLEPHQQKQVAEKIKQLSLSVRATETLVRNLQQREIKVEARKVIDPNISALQNKLAEKLGAKVAIQTMTKGKGKLIIHYNSLDELDGILEHIA
ncbi:MAG: ParB/RepB/Spo0J family partition protein [Gammaproteobacteria bacterium]